MKKASVTIFLVILLVSSVLLFGTFQSGKAQNGTNVSGTISANTTWSIGSSPFILTGNIFVQNGVTLTIDAGVAVYLNDHSLRINGTLNAYGTSDNRISFISLTPTLWSSDGIIDFLPGSSNWNEKTQSGSIIQNAIITYNQPVPAIFIDASSPKVSNCSIIDPYPNNYNYGEAIETVSSTNVTASPIITYNTIGNAAYIGIYDGGNDGNSIIYGNYIYDSEFGIVSASNATIAQNRVENNRYGVSFWDIWVNNTVLLTNQSSRMVQNNTFIGNNEAIDIGIYFNASEIIYNNFEGNMYNLYYSSGPFSQPQPQFINATYNWWGTTDLQAINQSLTYHDVTINYQPILTQPNQAAPAKDYSPNPIQISAKNPYSITLTHVGEGTVLPSDGQYSIDSSVTLSAIPGNNYAFMCWLENGTLLSTINPYSYSPNGSYVVTAVFYDPIDKISTSPSPTPSPSPSPTPTATPTASPSPTISPSTTPAPANTPTPTPTPSPTTVSVTTDEGTTVNLTINGNVTNSQMSNIVMKTNQSATTTTLSFTVTGQSGTVGFSNVTIPKSAVLYGTTPVISVDDQPAQNQGYNQDANNYYVWYTTHFSTHTVSIVFKAASTAPEFPIVILLGLIIIPTITGALIYKKRQVSFLS